MTIIIVKHGGQPLHGLSNKSWTLWNTQEAVKNIIQQSLKTYKSLELNV